MAITILHPDLALSTTRSELFSGYNLGIVAFDSLARNGETIAHIPVSTAFGIFGIVNRAIDRATDRRLSFCVGLLDYY